jgi:hypothetical protein
MANKIIKFNFDQDYDFIVFALVSTTKEYKLAWHINSVTDMDFSKKEDIELTYSKEEIKYISNYAFYTEYSCVRILKNKLTDQSGEYIGYLIPERKEIDFFLKIEGESIDEIAEDLPEKLKSLPCVQYFEKLKIENLKSKDNLLF